MHNADYWINGLDLTPHPEGGCYRETYRSRTLIDPPGFKGSRSAYTAIFFLLKGNEISRLHRIKSDEIWHFHYGSSLSLHIITTAGAHEIVRLGPDIGNGHNFQAMIPASHWFGATVDDPCSYSLVGCTVAPGFDFQDFELAERQKLLATYPMHKAIIKRLTP